MADDPKDPGTPPKDDKGGQGDGQGGGIEGAVRKVLTELGIGKGTPAKQDPHDIGAQVEAAVAKVHKGQQAEAVMAEIQARLTAVEQKKVPEKKPKEYRRITTRIWGADDDD